MDLVFGHQTELPMRLLNYKISLHEFCMNLRILLCKLDHVTDMHREPARVVLWSSAWNQLQSSSHDCTYSGKSPSCRDRTKRVMSNSSSIIIDQKVNWGTVCDR